MFLTLAGVFALNLPLIGKSSLDRGSGAGGRPQEPADIYISKNGTPQKNVAKVVEMIGGIEKLIGPEDIVLLKVNAQWWNQGGTNVAALKGFIDLVLGMHGFKGEVILFENHHFMDASLPEGEKDNIRGWTRFSEINGDIDGVNHNFNTLIRHYNENGHPNVTGCHLRDGGAKRKDSWTNGVNGGTVKGPWEGDGYVWMDDDYVFSPLFGLKTWRVKTTYPVFTSRYSGITIDFRNGAYRRDGRGGGGYLPRRQVKFINFAALNTHGEDTGITSALKNYMGITDLSCGDPGTEPKGYFNVHCCGGRYFQHAKAGPIGHFIRTVRKADLNVVTAEWVGWGDRVDTSKAVRLKTILAGCDPVALDYYSSKYLVYPRSGQAVFHDPDLPGSAIRKFLELARQAADQGTFDEGLIKVHGFDFEKGGLRA